MSSRLVFCLRATRIFTLSPSVGPETSSTSTENGGKQGERRNARRDLGLIAAGLGAGRLLAAAGRRAGEDPGERRQRERSHEVEGNGSTAHRDLRVGRGRPG